MEPTLASSPPLSPPAVNHGSQRSVAKNLALKLITSFGDAQPKDRFFSGNADDGKMPITVAATPILESLRVVYT
ncbi:94b833c9-2f6a-4ace-a758-7bed8e1f7690 [Thermothielavioides terrestris]|nr:94b833c9-2f6a-4ace-a758-7bed8e1f7690 [Thermothielavioides terrestris]